MAIMSLDTIISSIINVVQRYCGAYEIADMPGHYLVAARQLDFIISSYYFDDPARIKGILAKAHVLLKNEDDYEFTFTDNGEPRRYYILVETKLHTSGCYYPNPMEDYINTITSDGRFYSQIPQKKHS